MNRLNSHRLFAFLFILSIAKPIPTRDITDVLALGVIVEGIVGFLCLKTLVTRFRRGFDPREKSILFLCTLLLGGLFVSLAMRVATYPSMASLFSVGVATIAVPLLLPMSWLVFCDRDHGEDRWVGLGLLIFVHLVAFGQYFAPDMTAPIRRGTVGIIGEHLGRINSLMSINTVYGGFCALTLVFSFVAVFRVPFWRRSEDPGTQFFNNVLFSLLALSSVLGGVISTSRNFLWGSLIGIGSLAMRGSRRTKIAFLAAMLVIVAGVHVTAWTNLTAALKFGSVFPYLVKLHRGESFGLKDIVPQLDDRALSGRLKVWRKAVELWKTSPLFGCGPGSYRILSGFNPSVHVNNFYLQMLTEGGVVGFFLVILLLFYLLKFLWHSPHLPTLATASALLFFDNFLDGSASWVLTLAYIASWRTAVCERDSGALPGSTDVLV